MGYRGIFYGELGSGHGCHAYKAAYLNHIGQQTVTATGKGGDTMYCQSVGANSFDFCAHAYQHPAQLLYIRFTGCVIDDGFPFGKDCSHQQVGSTGNGSLVKQDILPV